MKFFDPVNHPKRSVSRLTIYGSVLTLSGTTTNDKEAKITINGIDNTENAVVVGSSLTDTAAAWVLANYEFYKAKGFLVSSAAAVITVVPLYGWETVNSIHVTITTVDTLTGSLTGVFEPDMSKAKTFQITLTCNITVKKPLGAVEGDRIRIEFKNPSTYTVSWAANGFHFIGGTEPTVTTTGICIVEATVNEGFFPRTDVITLTGSSGTANITAGGITRLATFAAAGSTDLDQTGEDFYDSWVVDFAFVGLALTEAAGVLTFTPTTRAANFYPVAKIVNVTTDLSGTVVSTPEGRLQAGYVPLDVKQ